VFWLRFDIRVVSAILNFSAFSLDNTRIVIIDSERQKGVVLAEISLAS